MTDNRNDTLSRRQVFGGVGLGLAAVAEAVVPGVAQAATPTAAPLQDPTTKYPTPPFKRQSQPWPGLAGKMEPRPDHGETSYNGSGRLAGRKALITGGDSGMGTRRRHRLCARGGRRRHQLPARRGGGCRRGHRADQGRGADRPRAPRRPARRGLLRNAGGRRREGSRGLDIVVSNAGRQQSHASILDISTEQSTGR